MIYTTIEMDCPGCGAPLDINSKRCGYCGRQIIMSTFNNIISLSIAELNKYTDDYKQLLSNQPNNCELIFSLGLCYLKLKLYDRALINFEKCIEINFDNSENYFYSSICLLKGKKAFLAEKNDIIKALHYINLAIEILPKGIYYYLSAYIKYDFHERKSLNITPNYFEDIKSSIKNNITDDDCKLLFDMLNIQMPTLLILYKKN